MGKFGVIFDMDGVIVDSEPVYMGLNKEIFKQLGIEVEEHVQLKFMGATSWNKWQMVKDLYHRQESVDELINLQQKVFGQAVWNFKSLMFPEVVPFLDKLQEWNVPIGLASSSNRKRVNAVMEQCGLKGYFKEIISGDEVVNGKPDPEIFLLAAKQLDLSPENCIVVEDSYNGLVAAKKANMYAIGVRHKYIKTDLSIADKVVSSLADIEL